MNTTELIDTEAADAVQLVLSAALLADGRRWWLDLAYVRLDWYWSVGPLEGSVRGDVREKSRPQRSFAECLASARSQLPTHELLAETIDVRAMRKSSSRSSRDMATCLRPAAMETFCEAFGVERPGGASAPAWTGAASFRALHVPLTGGDAALTADMIRWVDTGDAEAFARLAERAPEARRKNPAAWNVMALWPSRHEQEVHRDRLFALAVSAFSEGPRRIAWLLSDLWAHHRHAAYVRWLEARAGAPLTAYPETISVTPESLPRHLADLLGAQAAHDPANLAEARGVSFRALDRVLVTRPLAWPLLGELRADEHSIAQSRGKAPRIVRRHHEIVGVSKDHMPTIRIFDDEAAAGAFVSELITIKKRAPRKRAEPGDASVPRAALSDLVQSRLTRLGATLPTRWEKPARVGGHALADPLRQLAGVKWPRQITFKSDDTDEIWVWGLGIGGLSWLDTDEIPVDHEGPLGILGDADGGNYMLVVRLDDPDPTDPLVYLVDHDDASQRLHGNVPLSRFLGSLGPEGSAIVPPLTDVDPTFMQVLQPVIDWHRVYELARQVRPRDIASFIAYYDSLGGDWPRKMAVVCLVNDSKDRALEPMMLDILQAPAETGDADVNYNILETKVDALVFLTGNTDLYKDREASKRLVPTYLASRGLG